MKEFLKPIFQIAAAGIIVWILGNYFLKDLISILFFSIQIPVWLMLVCFSLSILIIVYFIQRHDFRFSTLKMFNEKRIEEILFRWKYQEDGRFITIKNISAHCPVCKTELIVDNNGYYECPNHNCPRYKNLFNFGYCRTFDEYQRIINKEILNKYPNIKDSLLNVGIKPNNYDTDPESS